MNLCDPGTVRQLMETFRLRPRREFGQNFLTDARVVEEIAARCAEDENETIFEIGPGVGTLTRALCARYAHVTALEIDRNLLPVLRYTLDGYRNVEVVNGDVMKTDLAALLAPAFAAGPVSVCANLPYYITTPILMKLLECGLPFQGITVMVQAEVADRLCAEAGCAAYGAITAMLRYYGAAERLFTVTAEHFLPPPKVDSAVVRIRLYREKPCRPRDEAIFRRTVRAAFEQRRKTLPNALAAGFPALGKARCAELVAAAGFPTDIRGERLDTAAFVSLSDRIGDALNDRNDAMETETK